MSLMVAAHDVCFGLFVPRLLLTASLAERPGRLLALLKLAAQDRYLLVFGEGLTFLDLTVLHSGAEHPQGLDAGPVPVPHRLLGVPQNVVPFAHSILILRPLIT